MFLTSVAAIARGTDLGEMPVSGGRIDPSFVLPEPGMDPPTRPPVGKGVSPPGVIPGHPSQVVSHAWLP